MRNTIILLASVIEIVTTLLLLPILLFHRSAWLVRRLDRLVSGIAAVAWMVKHG